MELNVRKLQMEGGRIPFDEWFDSLEDVRTQAVVASRLVRVRAGNLGDCKAVGGGVFELRIDFGPGLRVYFGRKGRELIVLVGGGSKRTQAKDIAFAQRLWKEYEDAGLS
jgi:putative addiction module killer protein